MPSVTKLLNRKKLGLTVTSNTTSISRPRPALKRLPGQPEIQMAQPRGVARARRPKIAQWTDEILANAKDPFQKAVYHLIQKGARQALLLTPARAAKLSDPDVRYEALCAYMTEEKEELWRGLALSSSMIPEVWQTLFTQGVYEIIPSIALKTQDESVNFIKKAFGLKPSEFFILVRCGSPHACTGILAIVSNTSLMKEITQAFIAQKRAGRVA